MIKLYTVSANTHRYGYGSKINLFLVTDSISQANKEADKLKEKGYIPKISEIGLNVSSQVYLGGYVE